MGSLLLPETDLWPSRPPESLSEEPGEVFLQTACVTYFDLKILSTQNEILFDVLHVLETFSNRTLVPHPPDVPLTPSEHSADAVKENKPFYLHGKLSLR